MRFTTLIIKRSDYEKYARKGYGVRASIVLALHSQGIFLSQEDIVRVQWFKDTIHALTDVL